MPGPEPVVGEREWLTAAETAKLVRAALKREHGRSVVFSVRSSTYAGGASISVRWVDGPTQDGVQSIVSPYAGGGFDGMIDLAYSVQSWLLPDGTACLAYTPGTEGSRGLHASAIVDPPSPDARLVRFGADHVFAERDLSPAMWAELEHVVVDRCGSRERAESETREGMDTLVWRESCRFDRIDGVLLPASPDVVDRVPVHCAWISSPSQRSDT